MSDDELIDHANVMIGLLTERGADAAAFVIAKLIVRLEQLSSPAPKEPPEGWKRVWVAVCVDHEDSVGAFGIDDIVPESDAIVHSQEMVDPTLTHQAIITADIPPISVPVVAGRVEGRT